MNNIYSTSPFETFFSARKAAKKRGKSVLTLRVFAPTVRPGERMAVSGNIEALGSWNTLRAAEMTLTDYPFWQVSFDVPKEIGRNVEYKFVLLDGHSVRWEEGENRRWDIYPFEGEQVVEASFRGMGQWRGAGTAVPVFSLRSSQSQGIGDFTDLRLLADWAHATGQRVIQILPVNDTTQNYDWRDSYPYRAISIFALHPLYLSIAEMGFIPDAESERLNRLTTVDYDAVSRLKWNFFRAEFARNGARTMESEPFRKFYRANKDWLDDYAAFCALRDRYRTADFSAWGDGAVYDKAKVKALCSPSSAEWQDVAIYMWLQYHLDRQLRAAVAYCRSKGVVLKGDIPIGISRDSVEAWSLPGLFNMNSQAGAPPDDFSVTGQNWGFPTYNWDVMAADGYAWWQRRFRKMADYFDLYRIDHILGFFRIWEIPMESVDGLLGHFNPAKPFSERELEQAGLPMNRERYLTPRVHGDFLKELFGDEDYTLFLDSLGDGYYGLKPEYSTQRKIKAALEGKNDAAMMALFAVTSEVLFIEDPRNGGFFHPRIAAQHTFGYRRLADWEKQRFDALYDDFFYRRHNEFWGSEAMRKLPALVGSTNMMCCGEDLGMIPDCVASVMRQLGILSLEIQRMPKDSRLKFGLTNMYPYMSVATTSTHDMSTVRGWWRENRAATQEYYNSILWQPGAAPEEATEQVCRLIVRNHLASPSALTILPLQDWLAMDARVRRADPDEERINIPANPNHYWRYRMHLTLEQLAAEEGLNALIGDFIASSGR